MNVGQFIVVMVAFLLLMTPLFVLAFLAGRRSTATGPEVLRRVGRAARPGWARPAVHEAPVGPHWLAATCERRAFEDDSEPPEAPRAGSARPQRLRSPAHGEHVGARASDALVRRRSRSGQRGVFILSAPGHTAHPLVTKSAEARAAELSLTSRDVPPGAVCA